MRSFCIDLELLQDSPIGIAVIESATGRILDANDAYCSIMGRNRDTVIGRTWMHFTHPDDLCRDLVHVHETCKNVYRGCPRSKRYVDPNGRPVHVDVSLCPALPDRYQFQGTMSAVINHGPDTVHLAFVVNRDRRNID